MKATRDGLDDYQADEPMPALLYPRSSRADRGLQKLSVLDQAHFRLRNNAVAYLERVSDKFAPWIRYVRRTGQFRQFNLDRRVAR